MNQEDEEFNRIERESKLRMEAVYQEVQKRNKALDKEYVRTWVGLTEDEAFACKGRDYFETYKAIEAKLKEKNT